MNNLLLKSLPIEVVTLKATWSGDEAYLPEFDEHGKRLTFRTTPNGTVHPIYLDTFEFMELLNNKGIDIDPADAKEQRRIDEHLDYLHEVHERTGVSLATLHNQYADALAQGYSGEEAFGQMDMSQYGDEAQVQEIRDAVTTVHDLRQRKRAMETALYQRYLEKEAEERGISAEELQKQKEEKYRAATEEQSAVDRRDLVDKGWTSLVTSYFDVKEGEDPDEPLYNDPYWRLNKSMELMVMDALRAAMNGVDVSSWKLKDRLAKEAETGEILKRDYQAGYSHLFPSRALGLSAMNHGRRLLERNLEPDSELAEDLETAYNALVQRISKDFDPEYQEKRNRKWFKPPKGLETTEDEAVDLSGAANVSRGRSLSPRLEGPAGPKAPAHLPPTFDMDLEADALSWFSDKKGTYRTITGHSGDTIATHLAARIAQELSDDRRGQSSLRFLLSQGDEAESGLERFHRVGWDGIWTKARRGGGAWGSPSSRAREMIDIVNKAINDYRTKGDYSSLVEATKGISVLQGEIDALLTIQTKGKLLDDPTSRAATNEFNSNWSGKDSRKLQNVLDNLIIRTGGEPARKSPEEYLISNETLGMVHTAPKPGEARAGESSSVTGLPGGMQSEFARKFPLSEGIPEHNETSENDYGFSRGKGSNLLHERTGYTVDRGYSTDGRRALPERFLVRDQEGNVVRVRGVKGTDHGMNRFWVLRDPSGEIITAVHNGDVDSLENAATRNEQRSHLESYYLGELLEGIEDDIIRREEVEAVRRTAAREAPTETTVPDVNPAAVQNRSQFDLKTGLPTEIYNELPEDDKTMFNEVRAIAARFADPEGEVELHQEEDGDMAMYTSITIPLPSRTGPLGDISPGHLEISVYPVGTPAGEFVDGMGHVQVAYSDGESPVKNFMDLSEFREALPLIEEDYGDKENPNPPALQVPGQEGISLTLPDEEGEVSEEVPAEAPTGEAEEATPEETTEAEQAAPYTPTDDDISRALPFKTDEVITNYTPNPAYENSFRFDGVSPLTSEVVKRMVTTDTQIGMALGLAKKSPERASEAKDAFREIMGEYFHNEVDLEPGEDYPEDFLSSEEYIDRIFDEAVEGYQGPAAPSTEPPTPHEDIVIPDPIDIYEDLATQPTDKPRGLTVPLFGEQEAPKTGYMVSYEGYEDKVPKDELSPEKVQSYFDRFSGYAKPGDYFGTWYNDAGEYVMDISQHEADLEEAMRLARERGQDAIFDLESGEAIMVTPEEEPEDEVAAEPEREPVLKSVANYIASL